MWGENPEVAVAKVLPFPSDSQPPSGAVRVAPAMAPTRAAETVARLRTSFRSGRTRPLGWRLAQLERLDRFLVEQEQACLDALAADLGKPVFEAWTSEVALVRAEIRQARRELAVWAAPERASVPLVHLPGRAKVEREPLGVVLIVGPWNYPLQLLLGPLVSALAAGNTAVLKPSEHAPASSALLGRQLPRYLDQDVVAVFPGAVAEAQALLAQRFDHIFYTGGGEVGRVVMEAAARHLTPVTLELGGKSPAIVDASANIEVAARRIAWGRFMNAGQTCVAPDYVLVERSVASSLLDGLRAALRRFYGDDPATSPDYGRIVNAAHLRRLQGLLNGVRVVHGGELDQQQLFLAPTLVWDPPLDSALMREEIFGPILPLIPVDDLAAAIDFVADRPDPLALYAFTGQRRARERVQRGTRSGGLVFNDAVVHLSVPGLPFGGLGPSGMGASHGRSGFETFSHRRSVMSRAAWLDPAVRYPPYSDGKLRLARLLL